MCVCVGVGGEQRFLGLMFKRVAPSRIGSCGSRLPFCTCARAVTRGARALVLFACSLPLAAHNSVLTYRVLMSYGRPPTLHH